jgi:uncharacterized protein YukE
MQKLDLNRVLVQVRELRAIADELSRNRSLANAMSRVRTSWEGQTSEQFRRRCDDITVLINNEVTNIRAIANSLESNARAIADAERRL